MNSDQLRLRILEVLASSPWPLRRRAISQQVFGDDMHGIQTDTELKWCAEHRFIESAYDPNHGTGYRTWRISEAGRFALQLKQVLVGGGDAA